MRRISRTFSLLAALMLGAACAVLVACGGSGDRDDLIPDQQAASMIDQLGTIQSAVASGRCTAVGNEVSALQGQINDLSRRVNARLRARLQQGVNNLANIGPDECFARRETTTPETTATETTTTQTTTETTPTETTTTNTVPTTTQTTPTTPETTPTTPQTTATTPLGGATVPGDTGGVGGATSDTP